MAAYPSNTTFLDTTQNNTQNNIDNMHKNISISTAHLAHNAIVHPSTQLVNNMSSIALATGTTHSAIHTSDGAPEQVLCRRCKDPLMWLDNDFDSQVCSFCTMVRASEMAGDRLDLNGNAFDFSPDTMVGDIDEEEVIDGVAEGAAPKPVIAAAAAAPVVAIKVDDDEVAAGDGGDSESGESDDSDDIDFFANQNEAEWCLEDEHEDFTLLGSRAFNDDANVFTPAVKQAEVQIAYNLLTFLNASDQLPASVLGTIVIDKTKYDASQEAELSRIENSLLTYSQRQQASAQATILLSTMLNLHDPEQGFAVRTEGLTAKRSRRDMHGDYDLTATRRWSKIKRAIRINKFIARDVVQGNPKLIAELAQNPDQYLFQKFENFRTNAKKGTVLQADTKKKRMAKTGGGAAS
ncbi:hypothetical protein LTR95_012265 [Oleoguttula sp. CCFEE 5521]